MDPDSLFQEAISNLINHPEYNSTLILRSDVVSDTHLTSGNESPPRAPRLSAFRATRCIHRVLLPRRPGRDGVLEQLCTFYSVALSGSDSLQADSEAPDAHQLHEDEAQDSAPTDTVILTPLPDASGLPYYHPAVEHLAMRYLASPSLGILRVEVLLPSDSSVQKDALEPGSKLARQCTTLLQHLHRYTPSYTPQSAHDRLFPREEYQDLYLAMRAFLESDGGRQDKEAGWTEMVSKWKERTGMDGAKQVYEDVGIACWLMLLWKDTFAPSNPFNPNPQSALCPPTDGNGSFDSPHASSAQPPTIQGSESEPLWTKWPRPPNGFLDLGCGNGLLTHILLTAGYTGQGVDVRTRPSWQYFPATTQQQLLVKAVDLLDILNPVEPIQEDWKGVWLIGNHADELTPWLPLLSMLLPTSGFASIPCCAWGFDARWDRGSALFPIEVSVPTSKPDLIDSSLEAPSASSSKNDTLTVVKGAKTPDDFAASLHLGGGANSNTTTYAGYRIWLASLHAHLGWKIEVDTLRIGSTRAWAIVEGRSYQITDTQTGRTRIASTPAQEDAANERARDIVRSVRERGLFKVRVPEGRAVEHR
ncbi:hypothetical protein HWV62_42331 [Athelia sp. TMB]|nr:hypothetical protein HWV62_42331 [Athelia sp. TMB]